jgi:type II secretory pathway component PulC
MLRLPPDVKAWLDSHARHNASSLNSEIVRSIRERMAREPQKAKPTAAAG